MVKIGVIGTEGKNKTMDVLYDFCRNSGLKVSTIKFLGKEFPYVHSSMNISAYISELAYNNIDVLIIKLTYEGLLKGIFSNIKFDTIICTTGRTDQEYKLLFPNEQRLFEALEEKDFIIMNMDDRRMFKLLKGIKANLITYGFNNRASITASSIQEEENSEQRIQCCIQRKIVTLGGSMIEPQEFPIRVKTTSRDDLYSSLAAITAALINEIQITEYQHTTSSTISII